MKRIKSLFDLIINDLIIIIKRIFSDCALCKWNIPFNLIDIDNDKIINLVAGSGLMNEEGEKRV